MVAQFLHQGCEITPEESSRFRGAGAWQHGGIEPVEIHGEIKGPSPQGGQGRRHLLDRHQPVAAAQFAEFLAAAAADGDLAQGATGQHLQAAAHGAGVAVTCAEPFLAQIGVGIELHQHQIGMTPGHRRHRATTDRMLTTEHQGGQAEIEHGLGGLFHRSHHRLGGTVGDGHRTQIGEGDRFKIAIQLGAVGLQPGAHLPDRGGPEAGAGPEGGGAVVGNAEQAHAAAGWIAAAGHVDRPFGVEQLAPIGGITAWGIGWGRPGLRCGGRTRDGAGHGVEGRGVRGARLENGWRWVGARTGRLATAGGPQPPSARARSTKAGTASKAPLCQRGLQISQPAATPAARSGWASR